MGCNNSRVVKVSPAIDPVSAQESLKKKSVESKRKGASINTSRHSLDIDHNDRGFSATSKGSQQSDDSGYVRDDLEDDYSNIITENSDGKIVEEIEKNFQPSENLDLCLTGVPAPRNVSARDKARLEEQRILESLRNEGLIATAQSECKNGLAFEVKEQNSGLRRALPPRLAKLERRKKKKKRITQEEIDKKLENAEQRRKEVEAEKIGKIHAVTAKSDINTALDSYAQHQQEIKEQVQEKVDTAAENREKRLKEMQEKLRAKKEHAEKVRLRKKLHIPTQEEVDTAISEGGQRTQE